MTFDLAQMAGQGQSIVKVLADHLGVAVSSVAANYEGVSGRAVVTFECHLDANTSRVATLSTRRYSFYRDENGTAERTMHVPPYWSKRFCVSTKSKFVESSRPVIRAILD